ncbi:TSUP family transporter [Microbacterium sp. zg.Y909]|uniref:TSUP family transporter n=1 Tax=Microbacterium sp. zg.Y909 TaxID=2969413 RepID=UPI00214B357B|nr:sulfite exporter TauE/SafE family protein [Microbacterium sp. zg.Y909]MCR2824869.1 sulfite exporter TauE/SafE family protein [Microbacterium sp. zg.Y909]
MIDLPAYAWPLLALGAVIVGVSKTALPGSATLAVAVFAALLPARTSTAALLVLLIVGDALALALYRRHADWRSLWRLAPAVAVGIAVGALFLARADDVLVRRGIGAVLILLVVVTLVLRRTRVRAPGGRAALVGYGALGGFTTMVANAGGPVMSLYFLAARFDVRSFLGTAAWFFAIVNVAKLPIVVGLGLLTAPVLWLDLLLVPAVLAGGLLGRVIAGRMTQRFFDGAVLLLTAVTALWLLAGPS